MVSPEGKVLNAKFIEGGKNGVTLHAPKGTAFVGNRLFVADIDTLRSFDRKTGKPVGALAVPGATFLNDVVATSDGTVYFTDTGMKPQGNDLVPSGSDAVYALKDGQLSTVVKDKDLGHPNGIIWNAEGLWV